MDFRGFLLIVFAFALIDAKKHHHHHKAKKNAKSIASTMTESISITGDYDAQDSSLMEAASMIQATMASDISSLLKKMASTATHTHTHTRHTATPTYHQVSNLKLVYQTVLPTGLTRANSNVVFEYADEQAGKKCRCVCRMKDHTN